MGSINIPLKQSHLLGEHGEQIEIVFNKEGEDF